MGLEICEYLSNEGVEHESRDKMFELFSNTIERYDLLEGIENVVYLFSGGKDATFGLYFINKYIKEKGLGVKLNAIMVTYPLHVYFEEDGKEADCYSRTKKFWKDQGVNLEVFISKEEDLKDGAIDGCKICKSARKKIVDNYLNNVSMSEKTAIVTGYTLYDILAYMDEYCLVTNYNFDTSDIFDKKIINRIQNCLHKMKIKEELPNGFRIIRPLAVFKEDDILNYINAHSIPYTSRPCKVSSFKHKRAYFKVLNLASQINNSSYEGVMEFLSKNNVDLPNTFEDISYDNFFTDC